MPFPKCVGLAQPSEGLNGVKGGTGRIRPLCLSVFELEHGSSPSLRLKLGLELTPDSPGSQAFETGLELHHWLS